MKKSIVLYYSKTGSNKYLAEKIAQSLKCDIESIKPRLNLFLFLLLFSLSKVSMGIKPLEYNVNEYDSIILFGPIWMGMLISPLRDFINKYRKDIKSLYFASCCASGDAVKDDKFGHARVFHIVENIFGDKCMRCEAFPIGLVLPEDKKEDSDAVMKTHLSASNFTGEIKKRFEIFIQKVTE